MDSSTGNLFEPRVEKEDSRVDNLRPGKLLNDIG